MPPSETKFVKKRKRRTIALKMSTYHRLEAFMVDVIKEKGIRRITFDEAVSMLLDMYYERKKKKEHEKL